MGASKRKQIVNGHAKAYVDAVFADRLQEEGFINLENRSLCWYRIVNNEIINMICVNSSWNNLPLLLTVGYGIHPLFATPFFTRSVHFSSSNIPCDHGIFRQQVLIGPKPQAPYSGDILVYAPSSGNRGLETLDDIILPEMQRSKTIVDCYDLYKSWAKRCREHRNLVWKEDISLAMSYRHCMTCIDTGIYLNDTDMYPVYDALLREEIDYRKQFLQSEDCSQQTDADIEAWQQRRNAMSAAGREEYLTILAQRKAKNVAMLKKKFGIAVE